MKKMIERKKKIPKSRPFLEVFAKYISEHKPQDFLKVLFFSSSEHWRFFSFGFRGT